MKSIVGVCFTKKIKFEWLLNEHFDYTTKGRKGCKMTRLRFSAWLYLIGWLMIFFFFFFALCKQFEVAVFACSCSVDFILLWKIMSKSCSISLLKSNALQPLNNAPYFNSIVIFFFSPSFPVKTLCITNAIWLAGAIVWKKVGPFCWVSRKAFKLSPHSLLPSYRNLLEVLFAGLDNGVWTLYVSVFWFFAAELFPSLMTDQVLQTLSAFSDVCVCGCMQAWCVLTWWNIRGLAHTDIAYQESKSSLHVDKLPWFKMAPVSLMSLPLLLWALCSLVTARVLADKQTQWEPEAEFEIRTVVPSSEASESLCWGRGSILVVRLKTVGC